MDRWSLRESDLKRYPHFDPMISAKDAEALATDAEAVAKHTFYPFIRYTQRWNRFADEGQKGKVKERPIRYAARRDAYIFSYYRYLLSTRFEAELERLGLGDSVLAYRRIPDKLAGGGKCNIHFAQFFHRCCEVVPARKQKDHVFLPAHLEQEELAQPTYICIKHALKYVRLLHMQHIPAIKH